jgi:hypothetical protein
MALRLRRGTDAERQLITPLEGELIYTTDTKILYIGDGVTQGGLQVTGALPESIDDLADVDISSIAPEVGQVLTWNGVEFLPADTIGNGEQINADITADDSTILVNSETQNFQGNLFAGQDFIGDTFTGAFVGDGSQLTNLPIAADGSGIIEGSNYRIKLTNLPIAADGSGIIEGSNYRINIVADDSEVMVDTISNTFRGTFDGDLSGSVFGDDSTKIIDGVNNTIQAKLFQSSDNLVSFGNGSEASSSIVSIQSTNQQGVLDLKRISESDLTGINTINYGMIRFSRDDVNGSEIKGIIVGRENAILFSSSSSGLFTDPTDYFSFKEKKFGIGTITPEETLDVNGNAIIAGTINAASFNGSLVSDDSTTIVDAINGSITASNFVQFGKLTTAERDELTASNGMVIYNTTDNKFQGYENGSWVNLV